MMGGLTIALDFDETYTADPQLWDSFITLAKASGHSVVCVTYRLATMDNKDIEEALKGRIPVVYTGGEPKEPTARRLGYEVNIWIDDSPELIPAYNKLHT